LGGAIAAGRRALGSADAGGHDCLDSGLAVWYVEDVPFYSIFIFLAVHDKNKNKGYPPFYLYDSLLDCFLMTRSPADLHNTAIRGRDVRVSFLIILRIRTVYVMKQTIHEGAFGIIIRRLKSILFFEKLHRQLLFLHAEFTQEFLKRMDSLGNWHGRIVQVDMTCLHNQLLLSTFDAGHGFAFSCLMV
jgi:hypothetical protein